MAAGLAPDHWLRCLPIGADAGIAWSLPHRVEDVHAAEIYRLASYIEMVTEDPLFFQAFKVTTIYFIMYCKCRTSAMKSAKAGMESFPLHGAWRRAYHLSRVSFPRSRHPPRSRQSPRSRSFPSRSHGIPLSYPLLMRIPIPKTTWIRVYRILKAAMFLAILFSSSWICHGFYLGYSGGGVAKETRIVVPTGYEGPGADHLERSGRPDG